MKNVTVTDEKNVIGGPQRTGTRASAAAWHRPQTPPCHPGRALGLLSDHATPFTKWGGEQQAGGKGMAVKAAPDAAAAKATLARKLAAAEKQLAAARARLAASQPSK